MTEQLGPMLVRLRQRKGCTQLGVAEALCAASGTVTVTRNEVSRWERQERIPSVVWLRWLAEVLEVPTEELAAAAAVTRKEAGAAAPARSPASAARAPGQNGTEVPRPPSTQNAALAVDASRTRDNGGDPLSRVTIEFEHRTTSVRLSATYDDPRRALSAIGAFRSMVGDDAPGDANPGQVQAESHPAGAEVAEPIAQDGAARRAHVVPLRQERRSSRAALALTASRAAGVATGIRATRGPGVSWATEP